MKTIKLQLLALVALFAPLSVMAAPIDLTAVTASFGDLNTAIAGIGALILVAAVLAMTYKWAKAMFFS